MIHSNISQIHSENRRKKNGLTGVQRQSRPALSSFSHQKTPGFQNTTGLLLILQLIIRLLKQLQSQNPPNPNPTEPKPELDLSATQREAIQNHFGLFGEQNFVVIDTDGNKKISAGDVVSISGGVTGGHIRDITLTDADIQAISGNDLSDAKRKFLANKEKWESSKPESYTYTLQRSGFLVADARKPVDLTIEKGKVTNARFSDGSKALVPDFNKLTIDDLFKTIETALNKGAAEVRVEYDSKTGVPTSIFIDRDRRIADEEVSFSTRNFKPVSIQPPVTSELNLSQRQQDAISQYFDDTAPLAYDGQATQYTGIALDKDGDNKLSVGDVVKLRMYGGLVAIGAPDFIRDHVLTAKDLAEINDFASNDILTLSPKDKSRLQSAVLRQDVAYIPGDGPRLDSVIDSNKDGKLSVGDTIKIVTVRGFETGNPTSSSTFQTLTPAQLDRYNNNIGYNPSVTITLTNAEKEAISKLLDIAGRFTNIIAFDSNGDGKLSAGDQLEITRGDTIGLIPESHILSESDIRKINTADIAPELTLSKGEQQRTLDLFGFISTGNETVTILDQDRNGKISVGDIAKRGSVELVLTEASVRQITNPPTGKQFSLNDSQKKQALDIFSAPVERARTHFVNIFDTNGDGKISEGDIAVHLVTPSIVPAVVGYHSPVAEVERLTLSKTQAAELNKLGDIPLVNLTTEEKSRLSRIIFPQNVAYAGNAPSLVSVGDVDRSGQLSVGDSLRIRQFNENTGQYNYSEQTLSQAQLDRYLNNDTSQALILTQAQHDAIASVFNHTPPSNTADGLTILYTGEALDADGGGHLSVGDIVKLRQVGGIAGFDRVIEHTLTASDLFNIVKAQQRNL